MAGQPLEQLHKAMVSIVEQLRQDPHALETVYISVIAFAGKASMIVPLVELMTFYPPRLPLGGGTALGGALDELMARIEVDVRKTTHEQRGDWEPIVYLLTDGRPTDRTDVAIKRWHERYASRAHLIGVALGKGADVRPLKQLTDTVVQLDGSTGIDVLGQFAKWVSASVAMQSQALDSGKGMPGVSLVKSAGDGISLVKDGDAAPIDDQVVVFTGRCHRTRKPYLLKYNAIDVPRGLGLLPRSQGLYGLEGAFPLTEEYFAWTAASVITSKVSSDQLEGVPPCPHCGAMTSFAMCQCGHLMCCNGPGSQTCPWCSSVVELEGNSEAFDVGRGQG